MKGLTCIIHTSISQNWQAFTTYFSVKRFLPEADIVVICDVDKIEIPTHYFNWTKRLQINHKFRYSFRSDPIINMMDLALGFNSPTLLMSSNIVIVDEVKLPDLFYLEREIVFINDKSHAENVLNNYVILDELNETDLISCHAMNGIERSFVSIKKECGSCINTMNSPFSTSINRSLTTNEKKILKFWSELALIYEAYN